jgi:hypothetical protein
MQKSLAEQAEELNDLAPSIYLRWNAPRPKPAAPQTDDEAEGRADARAYEES